MPQQRTIAEKVECRGLGLHSGEPVGFQLLPAAPGTGVVFACRQAGDEVEIPALEEFVRASTNATRLAREGASVLTVEHLLAVLAARGVDNARVEVDGPEIPAMDGSGAPFDRLLQGVGLSPQAGSRRVLEIRRAVGYADGPRWIRIEPATGFGVSYAVDFTHPAIGRQTLEIDDLTPARFETEIAPARTFGFLDEVEALRHAGFARGAGLGNTVVLDARGVMNEGGLRWPDEFVRHKVLDLVGDLALLGCPVRGHVHVERGGHAIHHALLRVLREQPEAWALVSEDAASA